MIKTYENGRKFLEEAGNAMLRREAVFQNILVNARAGMDRAASPDFFQGTVWNGEELILAFCNCHPWNFTIGAVLTKEDAQADSAAVDEKIKEAVKELAAFANETELPITGINASGPICRTFLTYYNAGSRIARKHLSMDIMVCRKQEKIVLQEGIYRSAVSGDEEWILEGCLAFEKEALGTVGSREEYRKDIRERQLAEDRVRLFCLPDNTPVCMVKRCRELKHGFGINQVYTLPQYRGKGYAQTLVYKVCEEFLKEPFTFATLYVDKKNPISNRVYQKVGFEVVEDAYDYIFKEDAEL